jgi:PIN domain nuclease of toxin-antitoxin system
VTFLLDTHIFLWALFEPGKLTKKAKELLLNQDNRVCVSAITFLEISLKFSLGKLELFNVQPEELVQFAEKTGFEIVPIDVMDIATFYNLPIIGHRDPFDRLLIWQCIRNNMILITRDNKAKEYEKSGLQFVTM